MLSKSVANKVDLLVSSDPAALHVHFRVYIGRLKTIDHWRRQALIVIQIRRCKSGVFVALVP